MIDRFNPKLPCLPDPKKICSTKGVRLGRLHQMSLWLLKHRLRSPTSSGHNAYVITSRQGITPSTICPRALQATITQSLLLTQ